MKNSINELNVNEINSVSGSGVSEAASSIIAGVIGGAVIGLFIIGKIVDNPRNYLNSENTLALNGPFSCPAVAILTSTTATGGLVGYGISKWL